MDIIHLLPDSVANQIAAGEVIQRPASCLKELVENSLDAGASRIQVVVRDAGRTLLQVVDNGKGMSETDVRMAFERHATSKIREAADLFALRTMGFRGEALASICAVAQVEVSTRRAEDEMGTRLEIAGSEVLYQEPCQCPEGTNIRVKNLFYNVLMLIHGFPPSIRILIPLYFILLHKASHFHLHRVLHIKFFDVKLLS